jgi:hypothetical protein
LFSWIYEGANLAACLGLVDLVRIAGNWIASNQTVCLDSPFFCSTPEVAEGTEADVAPLKIHYSGDMSDIRQTSHESPDIVHAQCLTPQIAPYEERRMERMFRNLY